MKVGGGTHRLVIARHLDDPAVPVVVSGIQRSLLDSPPNGGGWGTSIRTRMEQLLRNAGARLEPGGTLDQAGQLVPPLGRGEARVLARLAQDRDSPDGEVAAALLAAASGRPLSDIQRRLGIVRARIYRLRRKLRRSTGNRTTR